MTRGISPMCTAFTPADSLTGAIEQLLAFAKAKGLLVPEDEIYARNAILDIVGLDEPADAPYEGPLPDTVTPIMQVILNACAAKGLLEDTHTCRQLFDTKIMGCLMDRPSQINRRFAQIQAQQGVKAATDWFYGINRASDYIRVDDVARNIRWFSPSPYGELEITINLSKPEKDPREVAKLKTMKASGYPKCMLCPENINYAGRMNFPARQTHRTIPLSLNDEAWFFQYSPYVYYNEHCIVFKGEHVPMHICRDSFVRLTQFVTQFPHYFLGSNAGLPIVGGSILNHDHFQGGSYTFPMDRAGCEIALTHPDYPQVEICIARWPMSVLRLTSADPEALVNLSTELLFAWEGYSDPSAEVIARTGDTPHNTFTPIARRTEDGGYRMDLVLRNNRTSDEHPWGIFHPHVPLHHIKRENIGLIEVMGLFILPGRLKAEMAQAGELLCGKIDPADPALAEEAHPLNKHLPWLADILARRGQAPDADTAWAWLQQEIGVVCTEVLRDAGVFKDTPEGRQAFVRFAQAAGMRAL
jgi:UDPglucose--hexose-1-phosphate uridylyltransferase